MLAIGGVIRTVVKLSCFGGGQAGFVSTIDIDSVNSEMAVSLGAICKGLAIRGPAVPITWTVFGDSLGRSAFKGQCVDSRLVVALGLVRDDDVFSVGGDAVIVVAKIGETCVDLFWSASGPRNFV